MTDQLLMTAILSMDAYNEGYGLNNGPGPTVILPGMGANGTVTQIGSAVIDQNGILSDAATGFYGITYTWNGQTIIDFRGTDNPSPSLTTLGDILGGWVTGAGIIGGQALDAETLYQEVTGQSIFGPTDSNVILTGHSLGGGLAGLIGSLTGDQADVFDNMPYAASAVAAAVAYDISQGATNIAGLFTGQTAGYVYPTFDNVTAEYVDNEALQYIRALAPAAAAAVYSDLGPVVADDGRLVAGDIGLEIALRVTLRHDEILDHRAERHPVHLRGKPGDAGQAKPQPARQQEQPEPESQKLRHGQPHRCGSVGGGAIPSRRAGSCWDRRKGKWPDRDESR